MALLFEYQYAPPWSIVCISIILSYVALLRMLRLKCLRRFEAEDSRYAQDCYRTMDYKAAHRIVRRLLRREFPFMYGFGVQWALIKSYGIANGTKLLVQTRQLTSKVTVGKRAEDTGVFIYEILVSGIDSDRGLRTMAKMNWLHRRYGSKITNGDMIHTLGLFVLEPARWINEREWRALSYVERAAIFIYWKEIGNRMGMHDIPATLEDLETWMVEYEKQHMYYAESNKKCVEATWDLFLHNVPLSLHGFMKTITSAFIQDHVRPALGMTTPPRWISLVVDYGFVVRAFVLWNLFLPRFRERDDVLREAKDGRLYRNSYMFEPWYVQQTVVSRLMSWLPFSGQLHPGPEFKSNGFMPEELGPLEFEQQSRAPALKEADQLRAYAEKGGAVGVGCPFAFRP